MIMSHVRKMIKAISALIFSTMDASELEEGLLLASGRVVTERGIEKSKVRKTEVAISKTVSMPYNSI